MLRDHWMLGMADTSAVLAFHMSKTCVSRSRLFSKVTANVSCLLLLEHTCNVIVVNVMSYWREFGDSEPPSSARASSVITFVLAMICGWIEVNDLKGAGFSSGLA